MSDVYKNDELYPLLGEPIAPVVRTIPALRISTKKDEYLFYGNRIQLDDITAAYSYLRQRMEQYKLEQATDKSQKMLRMPEFAKKLIPAFGKKDSSELKSEEELTIDS